MSESPLVDKPPLSPRKFRDPDVTADGEQRAAAPYVAIRTLWFNTGTLCNLTCTNCYIESSPTNDRLVYLSLDEVVGYLDELAADDFGTEEIAFTGGEPFMNPDLLGMLDASLSREYRALVLTNAMRPMMKWADGLIELRKRFGDRLVIRVSLDHYSEPLHNLHRGPDAWRKTMIGLRWLVEGGFNLNIAGRTPWRETEAQLRASFGRFFAAEGVSIDPEDETALMLFPEMDETVDVPEITEKCWDILGLSPENVMCAGSRMVVKRKGAARPVVLPCTLLPYDPEFEMGTRLADTRDAVRLNHPHCARFCVLGGGSCSRGG